MKSQVIKTPKLFWAPYGHRKLQLNHSCSHDLTTDALFFSFLLCKQNRFEILMLTMHTHFGHITG